MRRAILHSSDIRRPGITVTKWDLDRLECMLSIHATHWSWRSVEHLVGELMRATIVDDDAIPANIVTMGSRVEYRQEGQASGQIVTLSYPGAREFIEDAISVLTPIGTALLGRVVGQSICYAGPDGRPITLTITRMVHQPEANSRIRSKSRPRSAAAQAGSISQDR